MVIRNETKLTAEEAYRSLTRTSRKNYYSRCIFTIALFVFGIIIVSLSSMNNNTTDTLVIGIVFLIVSLLFVGMNVTSFIRISKNVRKRNPSIAIDGVQNTFTFKEESFLLQIQIHDKTQKLDLPYTNLKKIVEEDDQILFVLSNTDVFVCKKDGFKTSKEMDVFFYGLSKHKTKIKKNLTKEHKKD